MNTASLKLCKELYELSGWGTDKSDWGMSRQTYELDGKQETKLLPTGSTALAGLLVEETPAYPLGYLLRKLPPASKIVNAVNERVDIYGAWYYKIGTTADTPEDDTAKLCIELFKKGVL